MTPDAGEGAAGLSRSARRRQRERNERLRTILAAAERFFVQEGYNKTKMEQIADEAEVSVGTVYLYFKNKEDLLLRMLDEIGFELRELLGGAFLREPDDPEEGLRRASQAFFERFCGENPASLAIIFRESVGQGPVVEEHRKKIFLKLIGDLKGALRRLAEAEGVSFRSDHALTVGAASILGTYERLAVHYLIWADEAIGREELASVAEDAVECIIGGVRGLLLSGG